MKGVWPESYLHNPRPNKPIEQIWDDLDAYSFEELYELPAYQKSIGFVVPLPPLIHNHHFMKGFCYTQGARLLINRFPDLQKLFFVCANSMCFSYPWSHQADCFFTCYRNPARESYYKNKYPETKNIICLPLQDADFTNDKTVSPIPNTPKTIDIFCVSTAFPVKNIPIIAQSLKIYEQKYGHRLKVVYAIGSHEARKLSDGTLDYSAMSDYAKAPLRAVDSILGHTKAYIDFIPYIQYSDLPKYYSAAKCGVLGSLIEGKNRFLSEGMSCDMPVIVFKDFNQFARGDYPVFFGNSGEYVPEFTAESLADTIRKVLMNPQNYSPRDNYLKYSGRRNFVRTVIRNIPYYKENLPAYKTGDALSNQWINTACQHLYQTDYESFLYGARSDISNVIGLEHISQLLKKYFDIFGLPFREILPEQPSK